MKHYRIWARIDPYQTVETIVLATNDYFAKEIGESMFGKGNVLGYTEVPVH